MLKKCKHHNLQQNMVCIGQICHKRVGCELCIHKHDHKFYLDAKFKQIELIKVKQQLNEKILNLKKYIKSNVHSLKLQKYKYQIQQSFDEEVLFFKNKIQQERQNFLLWIDRSEKTILGTMQEYKKKILQNWQKYYNKSIQYLNTQKQYEQLREYFSSGNWSQHQHVQKSVNFLYSQQSLFKFNRNMDNLKKIIHMNKKQNNLVLTWLNQVRDKFIDYELCPELTFKNFIYQYQSSQLKPKVSQCSFNQTKQSREDQSNNFTNLLSQDRRALLIYPKQVYDQFHHIYKLKRLNNILFATTGGRSINIWSKVNLQVQKVHQLDYTSYGLSTFIQHQQQDSDIVLFGKSNGQIGYLNMKNNKIKYVKGHQSAIRDIIQFDQYHFVTASQDWLVKIWGMNQKGQNKFAGERGILKGHTGKLHVMCKFGPNLLCGGADGSVKLWDIQSQSYDNMYTHEKQIYTITQIKPQLFLVGGQYSQINIFDYRTITSPAIRYPIQYCCNSSLKYNQYSFLYTDRNIVKLIDIRNYKQPVIKYTNKDTYSHAVNSMDYLSDIQLGMGGDDCVISIWKY